MESVLIADDEQNIRTGLKCILDWEALGFEICGEAANGEEALRLILEKKPSLVLLDIRMPRLYGTDLIRTAREMGYQGRFIILSGYSDFSYAQAAIRYGASFYLTKPIDEEELEQAVRQLHRELLEERRASENVAKLKVRAKDVLLHELFTASPRTDERPLLTAQEVEEFHLAADVYQVVIFEKFGSSPEDASYNFADLLNITNKGNHTFEYFTQDNHEVILLKGQFALDKFQLFLDRYEQEPPQKGSPLDSLFLAFGRPVPTLSQVCQSYLEAATLIERRFFCQEGHHTLGYGELPDVLAIRQELSPQMLEDFSCALTDYLLAFNRPRVAETLRTLEDTLASVRSDIQTVKRFLTDLFLQIKEKVNHIFSTAQIPFPTNSQILDRIEASHYSDIQTVKRFLTDLFLQIKEKVNHIFSTAQIPFPTNSQILDRIEASHYLYEIVRFLSEQAEMIMNATGSPNSDTVTDDLLYYIDHNFRSNLKLEGIAPLFGYSSAYLGRLINRATGESFNSYVDHRRNYIDHNFRSNLKLEGIAPLFGYSSAYLGRLINRATGESFNSYVDHRRIEYSKELLVENRLKVYEIAQQAGYSNVDYFHKKFKKYVGVSPAEYRKMKIPPPPIKSSPDFHSLSYAILGEPSSTWMMPQRWKPFWPIRCRITWLSLWVSMRRWEILTLANATILRKIPFTSPSPATRCRVPYSVSESQPPCSMAA